MTTQPEALRLADALASWEYTSTGLCGQAAAELRRLHAELERCKQVCAATSEGWRTDAALAEPVEPVAYSVGRTLHWHQGRGVTDAQLYTTPPQRKPLTDEEIEPLDCIPNVPGVLFGDIVKFARAVERAHGIT